MGAHREDARSMWRVCARGALYALIAALASGCVPVGVRVQNMFSALLG